MSILQAVHDTIRAFALEATKPCEIAIDAKVFAALEREVGQRAVTAIHEELAGAERSLRVRYTVRPCIVIDGVRVVRCVSTMLIAPESWWVSSIEALEDKGDEEA